MGRKKKTGILNVFSNGEMVGVLKKDSSGAVSFKYFDKWINSGFGISISLPISEEEYRGEVVSRYFDNLLPENELIRKNIATKFGAQSIRPFDLLEVIGRDCVGALTFLPEGSKPSSKNLEFTKLRDLDIARKIKGLGKATPLGMEGDDFRISIAGVQEKTALLKIGRDWCEPHGSTPTTHILKTSIGALGMDVNFSDSIDNEWACLFIMKKMGLDVCNASIEQFEDQRVLIVERFDRRIIGEKIIRVHQEDMCQALGISSYKKYQNEGGPGIEEISKFLMASKEAKDRLNFLKAILIFDLFYATDGHAKNFSIFLEPDGFNLTPFYDVMSGYFLFAREKVPLKKLKLAMKVGNSGHYASTRISKRHYQESAKKCLFDQVEFEKICSELKNSFKAMTIEKKELDPNLNTKTLEIIIEGMKKRFTKVL